MKPVRLHFPGGAGWRRWLAGHGGATSACVTLPLLAAALAATTGIAWQAWDAQARLQSAQQEAEARRLAKGLRPPIETRAGLAPLPAPQSQAWSRIAHHLNTPWSALLDVLESTTPATIALVAIEPDGRTGSVRLQVEAKTLDSLLAYAGELQSIEWFDDVALVKHETNEQDLSRPLRLTLDIRLKDPVAAAQPDVKALR